MANAYYTKGKEKILSGAINFPADTIMVALVKNTYPQNLTTDEFKAILNAYIVGTPIALSSKSVAGGAFDAADVTFVAVAAGDTVEAAIIYKDSGSDATSPLLVYLDGITSLPAATNGGDITLQWDNGALKILAL